MLRVGLIGFGLAGQAFHAPTIRAVAGLQLACVVERSGSVAQKKYPDVRVVRTVEELLADAAINLCVVATPNPTHFDLAKRCLLAGRHVVVDKPFAITSLEASELIVLARERQRLLTVFQSRRWDGDFRTVSKLLQAGLLGRIVEYEVRYDRFRLEPKPNAWKERPEPGSGVFFDLGPHLIDQALLLFGEPKAITASIFCQRDWAQVDDSFDLFLEYSSPEYSNLRVALRSRSIAYAPSPHFLINGTKGSFVKYGMDPQEEPLRSGTVPDGDWGPHWGEDRETLWGTLSLVGEASRKVKTEVGDYRGFYENVRDAIERGAPLAVTPEQALRTVRVLEAAQRSSLEGRTVTWDARE